MFSALSTGSFIYVLDKTSKDRKPIIHTAEVVGVSQPKFVNNQMVVDIKASVDGNVVDYPSINSAASIMSYNNGNCIISETMQGLEGEIRTLLNNAQNILSNIQYYKDSVNYYSELLKEVSPQYAKDKERDDRISTLSDKVIGMESKIDKLIEVISKEK